MALTDNLLAYWKLDETSGSRSDALGVETLTDNNTVTSDTGKVGNAASFASSTVEYLSRADDATLSRTGAFSFVAWLKPTASAGLGTGNYRGIITKWSGTASTSEYALYKSGATSHQSDLSFNVGDGSGVSSECFAGVTMTAGNWYFVFFYHDPVADTIGISVNDGSVTTVAWSTNVLDGSSPFYIGKDQGGSAASCWDGLIDEVGMWSRVLSSAEVTQLYNSGNGLTYPFSSIKTVNGLARASVKTVNGTAIASVKTINGLS